MLEIFPLGSFQGREGANGSDAKGCLGATFCTDKPAVFGVEWGQKKGQVFNLAVATVFRTPGLVIK